MATFIINRPTITRPSALNYTAGSDYIRGSGIGELLGYRLSSSEQFFVNLYSSSFGVDQNTARDAFFVDRAYFEATGEIRSVFPQFGIPGPNYATFNGDDRIYGRDGNDYIVDLRGNNLVVTEEGDDRILLGFGNDRIYDQGGNNDIDVLGGNNTITTGDGNDTITTGDGDDYINAFDGRNFIDAGGGKNTVRGGNDYDQISVGTGDDFVEVRGGFRGEDTNGNGVLDPNEDRNFNGVLDEPDVELLVFANLNNQGFEAHNFVIDAGGSDNIRSTASSSKQGDDVVFSDVTVDIDTSLGPFQFVSITGAVDGGDDTISLGAGDNLVVDAGGNNTVQTLQGRDIVYTSFFFAGDDVISTGAGNDVINPGDGADRVTGGSGGDDIQLNSTNDPTIPDTDVDTIVYLPSHVTADFTFADADFVFVDDISFFVGGGGSIADKIDLSAFEGLTFDQVLFRQSPLDGSFLVAIDENDNNSLDFGVDLLVAEISNIFVALPTADNFIFDTIA